MILHLSHMRRNVIWNVYNNRKYVSATTLQLVSTNKQGRALAIYTSLFPEMWCKPVTNIRYVIAFGFNVMHFRI